LDVAVTVAAVWTALAVVAFLLFRAAKAGVSAPVEEDELWVDPAGPFGWMRANG
jgi:hypothetical protein